MFSLIDAVIDRPMDMILSELPLSDPIKRALTDTRGRHAGYIELVRSYESGNWDRVARLAQALKLDNRALPALYLEACRWSDISARTP